MAWQKARGPATALTDYQRRTTHSRDPLARLSHRARTATALALVARHLPANGKLLDFGCAQGEFLREIRTARPDACLYGLDPFQPNAGGYIHFRSTAECSGHCFDVISALEVLEHLSESATEEFFAVLNGNLASNGVAIISVPNMLGPALAPKLMHGAMASGSARHYSWREALSSVALLKSPRRPPPNRAGTMRHKGYDWRLTRARIESEFQIVSEILTPFPWLWWGLNSQWICVFRPRPS